MFVSQQPLASPAPAPATFVPAVGDWVKVFLPRLGVEHEGIVINVARIDVQSLRCRSIKSCSACTEV
jgi:hypothetical protein